MVAGGQELGRDSIQTQAREPGPEGTTARGPGKPDSNSNPPLKDAGVRGVHMADLGHTSFLVQFPGSSREGSWIGWSQSWRKVETKRQGKRKFGDKRGNWEGEFRVPSWGSQCEEVDSDRRGK